MLELFSDRARHVVVQASDTARTLGHGFIGAEHLLLGVIAENAGVAARVLQGLGVSDEAVRRELLARHPRGERPSEGGLPFTAEGKSVLERSLVEAKRLGDPRIQTEHMLLALLTTEPRSAAELLEAIGVDADVCGVRCCASRRSAGGGWPRCNKPDVRRVGDASVRTGSCAAARRRSGAGSRVRSLDISRPPDVVFAIAQDRNAMPLLAELGIQVERVRRAARAPSLDAPASAVGDFN